jgi:tetratricopeptide (TPR) repeat protein
MPTILSLAGVTPPPGLDGRDLGPLLAGRDAEERPVYSESFLPQRNYGWAPLRAVRAGGFKLIDAPRPELYDLGRDPGEQENLHPASPGRAKEMAAALADLRRGMKKPGAAPAQTPPMDEETRARLRSLGYLGGGSGPPAYDEARARTDPKDGVELHEKIAAAQGLAGRHETDAARRLLEEIVIEDGAIAEAHVMLGEIAIADGQPERAIARFQRALALSPNQERSLFGLAKAYAATGRAEEALAGYRRILDLHGSHARAALAIADLYVTLGRFDDAAATLEQAAAEDGTKPLFTNKLGEVRAAQGREDEAEKSFQRAIAADPGFALPHFNLGVILEKRGDAHAAAEHYERAVRIEPGFCRAQFNLGRLRAAGGDPESARQLWEASLQSCPGFVQGHYYLAKLLMDSGGDLARAETLVRRGLALDPSHRDGPLGYYVLADLLNRTGRPEEGRRATAKGLEIQSSMR